MSILDLLGQQLGGGTLTQMSRSLGTDEATTAHAVEVALPLLLGGLAQEARTPQGAGSLDAALEKDHAAGLPDDLSPLLGGAVPPGANGILGHVFGGKRADVEQGVSKATGMSQGQVAKLLLMLAPIVMAALARRKREAGAGAGDLGGMLEREQQEAARRNPSLGGLGGLLDANHDGSIVDDLARMAGGLRGGGAGGAGGFGSILGGMLGGR